MARVNPIGAFMRSYGLKLLYFLYVPTFMFLYISTLLREDSGIEPPPTYTILQTIYIWCFRVAGILLLLPSLALMVTFLIPKFPPVEEGPDTDMRPGYIDTRRNVGDGKFGSSFERPQKLGRLEGMIVRIITRGEYPELIRRNAAYHVDLIERYCDCDLLEVHIVTESPIDGEYPIGKRGQVREIVVPATYRNSNETMFKARNQAYWHDNFQMKSSAAKVRYPPKNQTWILSLDEDAFVTDSFFREFMVKFIPSGANCSVSPSLLDIPASAGFWNGLEESVFLTLQCTGLWIECGLLKRVPLWFRGAAYVVRWDVDEAIGYHFTPELSITEDVVFGNYLSDSHFKVAYINGWNWEGAAPNLIGLIRQRGRWFRGIIYSFLYQKMTPARRASCGARLFQMYVLNLVSMVCAIIGTAFCLSGNWSWFFPVGPRLWPLDLLVTFAFGNHFYMIIFGAWHIMSTRRASLVTALCCCAVGVIAMFIIHLSALVWSLVSFLDDFYTCKRRYEVTVKAVK